MQAEQATALSVPLESITPNWAPCIATHASLAATHHWPAHIVGSAPRELTASRKVRQFARNAARDGLHLIRAQSIAAIAKSVRRPRLVPVPACKDASAQRLWATYHRENGELRCNPRQQRALPRGMKILPALRSEHEASQCELLLSAVQRDN